jgi:hypothetical protein
MKKRNEEPTTPQDGKPGRPKANGSVGKTPRKGAGSRAAGTGETPVAPVTEAMPNESWGLAALATFIIQVVRRTGEDAWWIGRALVIARAHYKEERGWLRWLRQEVEGLGQSTAYRYMDICSSLTLEEVKGKPIATLYKLLATKEDDNSEESAGDNLDTIRDHKDDEPTHDGGDQEEPVVAGKAPSAARGNEVSAQTADSPPLPPQPPVTADEIDALTTFLEAVGGLVRAEYVFEKGIEQLKELKDD